MQQGIKSYAASNSLHIFSSVSPISPLYKVGPVIRKMGSRDDFAMAVAIVFFPKPGGPAIKTPPP
jgi:hypothetical protein